MNVKANLIRMYGLIAASVLMVCLLSACGGMRHAKNDSESPAESADVVEDYALDNVDQDEQLAADSAEAIQVTDAGDGEIDAALASEQVEASSIEQPVEAAQLKPALRNLRIEQLSAKSNALIADMQAAGFYTFKKTAPSEYVLTLEDTTVETTVDKALLAPRGSGLIRSVRTVQEGKDVKLRVFADPTAMLEVKSRGGKLVVASSGENTETIDASEVMAQAALDEVIDDDLEDVLGIGEQYTGRLISLDLQDTDIDNALRIIAEVSNLNIIASDDVTGKVTLRLIDVPWDQALDVILKTNGLDKVQEGNVIRIAPVEKLRAERELLRQAQQAEEELEPLRVQYVRISYAKASELQPLVETVITERGTVAYDERTNQLIVKDITKGLRNVANLVQKLDLRTPQVLIETQIVEAQRNFGRTLGSELGFFYMRSPETGNALGYNFPNSVQIGGSARGDGGGGDIESPFGSLFPATNQASAVSFLFGSADGSKGLDLRLSQAEQEGKIKIVSRPSVAVTNNQPAVIKSVEKIRIKLPPGGVSVATGAGATAAGSGAVATEVIEVGIILNVTAQASPDYYVLLDVSAKSSALGNPERGVDLIPPEIERSANSSVLVSSGQTFAMGGIYRLEENDQVSGVPWLKDIPFLGHFFRRTDIIDSDEELIFFITPRIIEGSFDDAAMKGVS